METKAFNMKEHKSKLIILWVIVVAIIVIFFMKWWNSTDNVSTSWTSSVSGTQTSNWSWTIVSWTSNEVWTVYLLTQLKGKMKSVNPDLEMDWNPQISWEYAFIKFKCNISDESLNRLILSMNNGKSMDLKTIPKEQIGLLKKTMENDCNTLNSTMINKWMVFIVDKESLSYKNITPSAYFTKLENLLPVDFFKTTSNTQYMQLMKWIFSYENNINNIFSDKVKVAKVAEIYGLLKWNINAIKKDDADIQEILGKTDILIDYYTK